MALSINKVRENVCLAFPILAVVTLVLNVWKAFHGITMHDDAWYLFLLRDGYVSASQYNLLFHNVFGGNIAAVKISEIVLELAGAVVFAWGIWSYYRKENRFTKMDFLSLFSLVYISTSLFCVLLTVISYATLIGVIYYMTWGVSLYALSVKKRWVKNLCYFIAGLLCGLSPFVMITTIPMLFILWGFIFLSETKQWRYYSLLAGIVGFVSSVVMFFSFCLPFQEYVALVTNKASLAISGGLDETHGLKQILLWIYQSITGFYLAEILVGAMFVVGCYYLIPKLNKANKWMVCALVAAFVLYYYYTAVWRKGYSVATVTPFYICAALCIIYTLQHSQSIRQSVLYILLFFTPFFLALGTDTALAFRSYWYMGFILPVIYCVCKAQVRRHILPYFVLLVGVYWGRLPLR